MRKLLLFLGVLALFFCLYFTRAPRETAAPGANLLAQQTDEVARPQSSLATLSLPSASPPKVEILRAGSAAEIFADLFPVRGWSHWSEREALAAAQARFSRPLPPESNAHSSADPRKDEALARMGVLKAFGRKLHSQAALAFYRSVVRSNQPLLVRRQALENLRPFLAKASEAERSRLLQNLPPRLVALGAFSEKELLEEQWEGLGRNRRLSAEANALSLNKWENLPCPTPERFVELSAPLGWTGKEPYLCDLTPLGKFGRALELLASLELPVQGEDSALEANLKHPYDFLKRRSKVMKINLSLANSIATNRFAKQEITLGGAFFVDSPLLSISTLIHEARHSDADEDQGHTTCVQGDNPLVQGGCDPQLSDGKNAGAYSYDVFFELLLSETNRVVESDREFLRSDALEFIMRRFNQLQPRLAHFQDALAGLNSKGEVVVFHPFAREALRPEGLAPEASFERLAYNDSTGGLLLFLPKGVAKTWSWGMPSEDYLSKRVSLAGVNVAFASKGAVPYDFYAYSLFLDRENRLFYLDFDPTQLRFHVFSYPNPPPFAVKEFATAAEKHTYFLSDQGKLFRARVYGSEPPFVPLFAEERPFQNITGGVLRDKLYLVGVDGLLYQQDIFPGDPDESNTEDDPVSNPRLELRKTAFQAPTPAVQYAEGTLAKALLDQDGTVWLGYHGEAKPAVKLGQKVSAIAFLRNVELEGRLHILRKKPGLQAFRSHCNVKEAVVDPWFRRGAGVRDGVLYFEGDDGSCLTAALPRGSQGKVVSFSFRAGAFGEEGEKSEFFAPVGLELVLSDGTFRFVRPYEGWPAP